ncbi:DNA polymerase III, clamp loader complex, gamma/delta/delta subunit [Aspergillus leporis]|uniref:DNA polymerase III, clamp loader complex, gamma/delta/delta subunit n=1 Tax=Aspergillus leporis TaxID=41062 RepID=A0A5N5WV76_9EURO|nr:DNA polymerase III, clamp loader complex, gamma/delta/delta subunit [Aspergillus leporis]
MAECPICQKPVVLSKINHHIDSGCKNFFEPASPTHVRESAPGDQFHYISPFTNATKKRKQFDTVQNDKPTPVKGYAKGAFCQHQGTGKKRDLQLTAARNTAKRLKPDIAPLAERVRPNCFDDVVGQGHLTGPNGILRQLVQGERVSNMILWGGSGTGKTTVARIIASAMRRKVYEITSTTTATAEYAAIIAKASEDMEKEKKPSIVFCDEIHRITRPQQDIFLKAIRDDRIDLLGATTENPSLNIRHGLVYRCTVFTLTRPTDADIRNMLHRVMESQGLESHLLDDDFIGYLSSFADGDCRVALNLLEIAHDLSKREGMTQERLKNSLTGHLAYDRSGDQHYDTISAFHKSIRGSDADAALYYLVRMLKSGENSLFIARRLVVATSEDIGLANNALQTFATSVYSVLEKSNIQDAQAALAQLVITMCLSRKSTRSYRGLNNAFSCLKEPGTADASIPFHLLPLSSESQKAAADIIKGDASHDRMPTSCLPEVLRGRKFLEDSDFLFMKDTHLTDK